MQAVRIYQLIPSGRAGNRNRIGFDRASGMKIPQWKEVMSQVIPFYVPDAFRTKMRDKWVAVQKPAKVIQFRVAEVKKPA